VGVQPSMLILLSRDVPCRGGSPVVVKPQGDPDGLTSNHLEVSRWQIFLVIFLFCLHPVQSTAVSQPLR